MSCPRLYHVAVPGFVHSRSFRCIWLLEELGIDEFEVCMLEASEPYAPQMREYGVEHCHKVPTLQLNGQEIAESGVISQVLAETYQSERCLLGLPEERLELLQWMAMAETCITFRIPWLPALMNEETSLQELHSGVIRPMKQIFRDNVARFEARFAQAGSEYLLESGFSVADTMCGWSLHTFHTWGIMDLDTGSSPRSLAYLERLQERPAFKSAERYEEVPPGLYGRGCVAITKNPAKDRGR